MKRWWMAGLGIVVMLILVAIFSKQAGADRLPQPPQGLGMRAEQQQYSTDVTAISLTLVNGTDAAYAFDLQFMLQQRQGETWVALSKPESIIWIEKHATLAPHSEAQQYVALSVYTERLVPGQYRILKIVRAVEGQAVYQLAAEFAVEAP